MALATTKSFAAGTCGTPSWIRKSQVARSPSSRRTTIAASLRRFMYRVMHPIAPRRSGVQRAANSSASKSPLSTLHPARSPIVASPVLSTSCCSSPMTARCGRRVSGLANSLKPMPRRPRVPRSSGSAFAAASRTNGHTRRIEREQSRAGRAEVTGHFRSPTPFPKAKCLLRRRRARGPLLAGTVRRR